VPNPRGINQHTKGGGGGKSSKRKGPPKASKAMMERAAKWKPKTASQLSKSNNRRKSAGLTKWK
jgi:hypothetical protein